MSNRIRRHVDPLQCQITLTIGDWLEAYCAHGQGEIWLDLGCGKGEMLAGLAELHPGIFFMGIDVRKRIAELFFPRYRNLANLLLLHGNVNSSIPSMMDRWKVQRVFINFPDPYDHRRRYKKRQMVDERLVEGLCDILAPGGVTSVKTDNKTLFEEMDHLLSVRLTPIPALADTSLESYSETSLQLAEKLEVGGGRLEGTDFLPQTSSDPSSVPQKAAGLRRMEALLKPQTTESEFGCGRRPALGDSVLTEWEDECRKKSLPVCSREYRFG